MSIEAIDPVDKLRIQKESAARMMAESDFPALLEELSQRHLAETGGLLEIHHNVFPERSEQYIHKTKRKDGREFPALVSSYEWVFPHTPREESDYFAVLWSSFAQFGADLKPKGFIVEAMANGLFKLLGRQILTTTDVQIKESPDVQGRLIEFSYQNPFHGRRI